MKYLKTQSVASVVALGLLAAACDQGLTEVNQNPNAPTTVTPELLFPNAVTSIVTLARGSNFDLTFTSLWAQQIAKVQYTDEDRYDIRVDNIEGWWQSFYANGLQDLKTTIEKATELKKPNQVGPALVMKSWTYGTMTDVWGDIPYSEAGKGSDAQAVISPKFDTQQEIYNGMFADLKAANDMMSGTAAGYGSADPIYSGNITRWKKFANSLRMRDAMRLSKVDPAKARAEFVAGFTAGPFTDNADNAQLTWTGEIRANENPWFNNFRTRDDHRMSKTMVDMLKKYSDPRLPVFAQKAPDVGDYVGLPNGLTSADANKFGLSKSSKIGTFFSGQKSPSFLMNFAEVSFLEAEAALNGWISGSAETYYNAGITASLKSFGIADAEVAKYLAQPGVKFDAANAREQIATQKWISLMGQGSEAYAEWRRTGFPRLSPAVAGIINTIPRRIPYPLSEQSFNKENLDAARARQGSDALTSRVWWDK